MTEKPRGLWVEYQGANRALECTSFAYKLAVRVFVTKMSRRSTGPIKLDMLIRKAVPVFISGYFATCKRSPKTLQAYAADLRQFSGALARSATLASVRPETIEEWASALKAAKYAPASIRRKLASVTSFFNYWVRRRMIERSPLWQLRLDLGTQRLLTKVLTAVEVYRLLERADVSAKEARRVESSADQRRFLAIRDHAIVELMFATGMRVGEVASLTQSDVLVSERAIIVRGKGDRQRLAFLVDDRSYRALHDYLTRRACQPSTCPALFVNAFRGPLSTQGIANIVGQLAAEAGIERRVTPHMLRHTVATLLLTNGADIRIVQEFLGHASISTTQRYTHVSKEHLLTKLKCTHPNLVSVGANRALGE